MTTAATIILLEYLILLLEFCSARHARPSVKERCTDVCYGPCRVSLHGRMLWTLHAVEPPCRGREFFFEGPTRTRGANAGKVIF